MLRAPPSSSSSRGLCWRCGPRSRLSGLWPSGLLGVVLGLGGCFGAGAPVERVLDEGPDHGAGAGPADPGPEDPPPDDGPPDPHGTSGIDPPHGSFAGGLRAVVRGSGFAEATRVWIGGVPAPGVVVLGPNRVQIATPPGEPGPADVTTQLGDDESTRRTLEDAFTYDRFQVEPDEGPTSGGIDVILRGRGTSWNDDTVATFGGAACTSLEVLAPDELRCELPPGTVGAKPVRVGEGDDATTVLDAFTYDDTPDGVAGGLEGAPLDGRIEVRSFNAYTGEPLEGATVILGDSLEDAIVRQADAQGRVVVEDAALTGSVTVTVAVLCHQPMTFVDVPVDRVNVYLDPVLVLSCADEIQLPPPPSGSGSTSRGKVSGQIHWDFTGEFQRGPFDVPPPGPGEEVVAYVFTAASSSGQTFNLPPASLAITPETPGGIGYSFEIDASPGNRVLYALAGLEDRSAPVRSFVPWSMGVLRGVTVRSDETTEDVAIHMSSTLEHALDVLVEPPAPTERGPDRLLVSAAIRLGTEGWLPMPQGRAPRTLPFSGAVGFFGLPLLDGPLAGGVYEVGARAGTGPNLALPVSAVGGVSTTVADEVQAGAFVGVPLLVDPAPFGQWDGRGFEIAIGQGSSPIDVVIVDVALPGDLVRWRIAAPGATRTIRLPDLRELGLGLPPGALRVALTAGRIDGLIWGELAYRDLRTQNMDAFASDLFDVH